MCKSASNVAAIFNGELCRACCCCCSCWAFLIFSLPMMMKLVEGQGYLPPSNFTPEVLGVAGTHMSLQQIYEGSKTWKTDYQKGPAAACNKKSSASLCAADNTEATDSYAQLLMATSPSTYSSTNATQVGPVRLVAPAENQQSCDTCVAFAVTTAAETAMASALGVPVENCSISVQGLYFCPPGEEFRSCKGGWTLLSGLQQLQQRSSSIPTAECLPYQPDIIDELNSNKPPCDGACSNANDYASQGSFTYKPMTSIWAAQRHIRRHGSVVTRFDVYSDFHSFYNKSRNAQAIYWPAKGATYLFGHAVVLVGYNNEHDPPYWIVKNSYGSNWGADGFFKVAFGNCSVLTADSGEAYGLIWTLQHGISIPAALQLPVTPAQGSDTQTSKCFWYKAQPMDYLSRVAWMARIKLAKFMLDNIGNVKALDAPLAGARLLLCDPAQGTYHVIGSSPADPQLESLLQIKAAIDSDGVLKSWSRQAGQYYKGYCNGWVGVSCDENNIVKEIDLTKYSKVQGLSGQLPSASILKGLPGLQSLSINDQPGIGMSLRGDWSSLQQLTEVDLSNNGITGTLPSTWGQWKQLKSLTLQGNKLSGPLPDAYKALTLLEGLFLSNNSLTGTLPPSWAQLKQLRQLYLWRNQLSGPLPDNYKALTALEDLELQKNYITGTLPPSWGQLQQLKFLYLHSNELSGSLPGAYKNWTAMQELKLYNSHFIGSLPHSWGQMKQLKILWLDGNKLSGPLPDAYKALTALEQLSFPDNSLTGTLPSSWSELKLLRKLWLQRNKLSGVVPTSWSSLKQLERLDLHGNPQLTGCLPASWKQQLNVKDVQAASDFSGTGLKGFC